MKTTITRYEIEWPTRVPLLPCGGMDSDNIEWSVAYRKTLRAAHAYARKACHWGDTKVAYVTKQTYIGPDENPRDTDWRWENDLDTRTEFTP